MANRTISERLSRPLFVPSLKPRLVMLMLTIGLLVGFGQVAPAITSPENLSNILVQASYLVIFAVAQSIVILTRGFDLSLGTTVSLTSVIVGLAMTSQFDGTAAVAAGILAGLVSGAAVGAFNGFLVAIVGINPFVVTLGTMNILLALSTTVSGGFPVAPLPAAFSELSSSLMLGIPIPVWVAVVVVILTHIAWNSSVFGRSLYLIGSNPRAAHVAGINTRRYTCAAYVLCSALVAVGAILLTSRTGSGEPNLGGNLTLQTIAAAVLGGMRLNGGEGDILAPVLGALLVTVLANGMNLLQIDGFLQEVCLGVLILATLAAGRLRGRL